MMQAMQNLQLLQEKVAKAQLELETLTVEEHGGDRRVTVTVDGKGRIRDLAIVLESTGDDERELLEDLILTTINRALDSARALSERHLAEATAGLIPNIPGLNLPFS